MLSSVSIISASANYAQEVTAATVIPACAGKRSSGRQTSTASDNPELRLEDLSRQIAQLRKGQKYEVADS